MAQNNQLLEKIVQYMKQEALQGHFEHSINEIHNALGGEANRAVDQALWQLETTNMIGVREKGKRLRKEKYYHLCELIGLCRQAWS